MKLAGAFATLGVLALFVTMGVIALVGLSEDTTWPASIDPVMAGLMLLVGTGVTGIMGAVALGVTRLLR